MEPISQAVMDTYLAGAREMLILRDNKATLEKREKELKAILMDLLSKYGSPYGPEGQHQSIAFPAPIRGKGRLVRQNKHMTSVNEIKAEAIARSKNIYDRLFKPVPTLDQDAVMVAVAEGLINEVELSEIFVDKPTNAFVVEK